jgi:hypothetical protein
MTTIATFPHGLTAVVAVTLATCSGNETSSRSGAKNSSGVTGGPGTVLVKLPLRATKRGEMPE